MSKFLVKVKGLNAQRTLNTLTQKGIDIKNSERYGSELFFEVGKKDLNKTKECLNKLYLSAEISEKKNSFESIFSLWRFGLILGILLCVIIYCSILSFILRIEISGIDENQEKKVMLFLKENGIIPGTKKSELDLTNIESIIIENFEFSVVSPSFVGTSLVINVKEELSPPIYMDLTKKTPLIASEDALITRIVCGSGTKVVNVGKSVKKGEVLIDCKKNVGDEEYYVRATGEVYGKIWRQKEIFVPTKKEEYVPTGNIEKVRVIRFGNYSGVIKKSSFKNYTCTQTSIRISDFLPIYVDEIIYTEQKTVERELTVEEENNFIENAKKEIFAENQNLVGEFIDLWTIQRNADGGKIIKVIAEFETKIDVYK